MSTDQRSDAARVEGGGTAEPIAVAGGLLYALSEPPADAEDEFNEWYDDEHVALRLGVPGLLNARRYVAVEGSPTYMACYDLESPAVLEQPQYTRLRSARSPRETALLERIPRLERRIYRSLGAPAVASADRPQDPPFIMGVGFSIRSDSVSDFHRWYAEEHIPLLLRVPGWLRIRRFELLEGDGPEFLALHEMASLDAFNTPEHKTALDTPWRRRVHEYKTRYERNVYRLFRTFPIPAWGRP